MSPDEVEAASGEACCFAEELVRVAGVKAVVDVARDAGDAEFRHTSRQVPLPVIGSKTVAGPEVAQQVFDEIAAAIAGIAAVAIFAGAAEMVQAGQVRDGAGIERCPRQLGIDRLVWLAAGRVRPGRCGLRRRD